MNNFEKALLFFVFVFALTEWQGNMDRNHIIIDAYSETDRMIIDDYHKRDSLIIQALNHNTREDSMQLEIVKAWLSYKVSKRELKQNQ